MKEIAELKRANGILKAAATFFAAESRGEGSLRLVHQPCGLVQIRCTAEAGATIRRYTRLLTQPQPHPCTGLPRPLG
ncbi:hypothetical protein [Kitasatospora phosalacinea]|uniref:hypothetical protein n=1 Tax=Kitasatospora phosalacinea TaxID=2065 RepID=UPI000526466D|nr:hypothetical protein [Kitasatospora phosalacinea]